MHRRVRRSPRYDPQLWNVYERTLKEEDRTNNKAEAANRRLHVEFDCDHPSIWKFIKGLWQIQKGNDKLYEDFVSGKDPEKKKRKFVNNDARILTIVKDYANRTPLKYLWGLSSTI